MNKTVVIVGLFILAIISFMWSLELSVIEVGNHVPFSGEFRESEMLGLSGRAQGETWEGLSPEAAAEKRAKINTLFGVWFFLTLAGTHLLGFESKRVDIQSRVSEFEETVNKLVNAKIDAIASNLEPKENYAVCPYCFENIKAKALKCKHCHSLFNQKESG